MKKFLAVTAIAGGLVIAAQTAQAQGFKGVGKYAAAIIENNFPGNPTCAGNCNTAGYSFASEKSKVQIKPSGTDGDGGIITQLGLKFVNCPGEEGNDGGAPGACGPQGSPATNHVFVLESNFAGIVTRAGVMYDIEKGKGAFQATGKNKVGGAAIAGPLVTAVFQRPLGIGQIQLKTPGSNVSHPTTGCGAIPLPPVNTCSDGQIYGVAGIRVGEDQALSCVNSAECADTQICSIGACTAETCTLDADCDQNGGGNGGTGECGSDGQCCDPVIEAGCAAEVP
jgi:hypothetical protein